MSYLKPNLNKQDKSSDFVPVRFLSQTRLQFNKAKDKLEFDVLIFHIHGGGFIATSSASHQTYLRKFARDIPNSLIVSVDYRLAPEYRYPT